MFVDTVTQLGLVAVQATAPTNPLTGDLWQSTVTGALSVWSGTTWVTVKGAAASGVKISATAPVPANAGDLWLDTVNNELKTYDGAKWLQSTHDGGRY